MSSSSPIVVKVAVLGASGHTGMSVVNGLLASSSSSSSSSSATTTTTPTKFEIMALTRPSSVDNEANRGLAARGVQLVPVDLTAAPDNKDQLVGILRGVDTVVSCTGFQALMTQIPLAEAAKEAGVKRFVPCDFGTPAPRGVMKLDDWKDDVLSAIQRLYLPYTVIHVGWWSRQAVTALPLPSKRIPTVDSLAHIPGDGNVPVAYTDLDDVGHYVARIITDPRTLNKKVFAYTDLMTVNQVADLLDEVTGEKCKRNYLAADVIQQRIKEAHNGLAKNPEDFMALVSCFLNEYIYSWGVRGDNQPESAKYLGYLDFKELYPEAEAGAKRMKTCIERLLSGEDKPHYS